MLRHFEDLAKAVVKVGAGRGFVIEHSHTLPRLAGDKKVFTRRLRLVVTAAHCLPHLPPAHGASHTFERTYQNLLGTLKGEVNVWAECVFVDPVADIAVLGSPDDQELFEQSEAYDALTDVQPFEIAFEIARAGRSTQGFVMDLDGTWIPTTLNHRRGLEIDATKPGMSGSPILNRFRCAIGIVVLGTEVDDGKSMVNIRAGNQPILVRNLPGWLLRGKAKPKVVKR